MGLRHLGGGGWDSGSLCWTLGGWDSGSSCWTLGKEAGIVGLHVGHMGRRLG